MEDRNDKKGFDDFFATGDSGRTGDRDKPDAVKAEEEGGRPAYYYSYGPTPESEHERQNVYDNPSSGPSPGHADTETVYRQDAQLAVDNPAALQSAAAPPRTFTVSPAGNGNWRTAQQPRRTSFRSIFLSFIAGMLVVGGLMYTADVRNWFTGSSVVPAQSGSEATGSVVSNRNVNAAGSEVAARPDNIAQLFQTASPAVVKIETYVNVTQRSSGSSLFDDPFFRQFFGDNFSGQSSQNQEQGGNMQQSGIGTGFFFEADGHILTNQHVVGDADEIRITVQGYDEPFKAKLLGASYELDLAVLKIEGDESFPTLPLGNSDDIAIGDWVVAIGNPYGFDHTITVGVLSAKERPINIPDQQGERRYKHLLQTDASINPGNSGGPLLNVNGEVIGINTAVSSEAQGIGFAIPTTTIESVLDNLKNSQEIPKEPSPFIGAQLRQMNEQFASQLGLELIEGSLVSGVYYNSPAYHGDLRQYDVIVGIEGVKYVEMTSLIEEIQKRKVGDQVEFNIIRQGKAMDVTLEIGDKNAFGLE